MTRVAATALVGSLALAGCTSGAPPEPGVVRATTIELVDRAGSIVGRLDASGPYPEIILLGKNGRIGFAVQLAGDACQVSIGGDIGEVHESGTWHSRFPLLLSGSGADQNIQINRPAGQRNSGTSYWNLDGLFWGRNDALLQATIEPTK